MNGYYIDGSVIRDTNDQYVGELIASDNERLSNMLEAANQLATVTADRDIKAANLQLLVDKVLAFGDLPPDAPERQFLDLCDEAVDLARGLKQ